MKPIIYIDMDDVLCDYSGAHSRRRSLEPETMYPQSQDGYFRNLEPISGGLKAANDLQAIGEVYILTAPSVYNPLCYSEKREWVEKHLGMGFVNRLIISPNKGLNKGDYLIDDHKEGRGQENFEGKLLHFGSPEFPDWKTVMAYFDAL